MRPKSRRNRLALAVTLIALGTMLGACENFDMDKLDVFGLNEKKKLPGERKALFPEGVPGVQQGIPPEYMKGYQPPPDNTPATAAEELKDHKQAAAEEEPKAKPKPRPKAKPRVVKRAPAPASQPAAQDPQAPWPNTPPQQQQQQSQQPQQNGQQAGTAAWPQAPQPGTFSR